MSQHAEVVHQAFDLVNHPLAIAKFSVKQLLLEHANQAFAALLADDELIGKDVLALFSQDSRVDSLGVDEIRQSLVQHNALTTNMRLTKDAEAAHVTVSFTPLPDSDLFAVCVQDSSDLVLAQEKVAASQTKVHNLRARLDQLSKIDSLTGVYNPKAINHELSILFNSAKRNYGSFSILFIEIDKLDEIEAERGEKIQQKCIEHFAINLTRNFRRRSDIIIRYNASQFLVCFAGANDAQTYNLADKILRAISNIPVIIEGSDTKINLSISIGMFNVVLNLDANLDHSIGEANIACEQAKKLGGNQIYVSEIN